MTPATRPPASPHTPTVPVLGALGTPDHPKPPEALSEPRYPWPFTKGLD